MQRKRKVKTNNTNIKPVILFCRFLLRLPFSKFYFRKGQTFSSFFLSLFLARECSAYSELDGYWCGQCRASCLIGGDVSKTP
jgi:hypothetical protein